MELNIWLRTRTPLSTFPSIPLHFIPGKALCKKKGLGHRQKGIPFVALIIKPEKIRERKRFTTEKSFVSDSAGFVFV